MSEFNYQAQLQELVTAKQLAQVSLLGVPAYKMAYILSSNEAFLTFAEVSSSGDLAGVVMCRMHEVESVKVDTIYGGELQKIIDKEALFEQIGTDIEGITEFTFEGFAAAFKNRKTLVEITYDSEDVFCGRIVNHSKEVLAIDEFYAENDRRFARSFISFPVIVRMSVDVPWIRTIQISLTDKNL